MTGPPLLLLPPCPHCRACVGWSQDVQFYEQLKTSPYVVSDPETADYFYLPIYIYWHTKKFTEEQVAAHLRKAGPWFDRKHGADHIFAVSGDFAR